MTTIADRDRLELSYWGGRKPLVERTCPQCGEAFTPAYGDKRRRFCSHGCSRSWSKGYTRSGPAELSRRRSAKRLRRLRDQVLERDGPRCGICGSEIDLGLLAAHPGSLTLDHVTPISAGGAHEAGNLWPAHRSCNEAKGDDLGYQRGGLLDARGMAPQILDGRGRHRTAWLPPGGGIAFKHRGPIDD